MADRILRGGILDPSVALHRKNGGSGDDSWEELPTNTIFVFFFRSAPEISLNPEESHREEIYFSDSVSQYHSDPVSQYHSDPGAEEPLLSNKTNSPSYTV